MHTREVTYTDSKGHTHTRTEIYWTWDRVKREEDSTETFSFMGVSFPADKFSVSTYWQGSVIYDNSVSCGMITQSQMPVWSAAHTPGFKDHMIAEDNEVLCRHRARQTVVDRAAATNEAVLYRYVLVFWIALTCGAVYGFCALENRWLDG